MTAEEELIHRYFDAFNSHDIEGVMACFDENPVLVMRPAPALRDARR